MFLWSKLLEEIKGGHKKHSQETDNLETRAELAVVRFYIRTHSSLPGITM